MRQYCAVFREQSQRFENRSLLLWHTILELQKHKSGLELTDFNASLISNGYMDRCSFTALESDTNTRIFEWQKDRV